MGLFDSIGSIAGTIGGGIAAGPLLGQGLLGANLLSSPINKSEEGLARPVVGIDDNTQRLMGEQSQRAGQGPGYYTEQQMQGVGNPQDLKAAQEQIGQRAGALGGSQSSLGGALNARTQRNYGANVSRLQRGAELNAPGLQSQQQQIQAKYANESANVALQNLQRQHDVANQQYAARTGIIGQILGGAGSVMGAGAGGAFSGSFNSSGPGPLAKAGGMGPASQMSASNSSGYIT